MPRFLQMLALVMAFAVSGAPSWVSELLEDDCAEECWSDTKCPEEGCADCSILCSSCPRSHVLPAQLARFTPVRFDVSPVSYEAGERVPVGPPPRDVFHPPRRIG